MAHGEQTVELYDFLYRDSNRVSSYYAQFFGGKLSSLESAEVARTAHEKDTRVNAGIVNHGEKVITDAQDTKRQVIDPHDVITVDVLSHLSQNRYIYEDIEDAPHGSMVLIKGTLWLSDRTMIPMATATFDSLIRAETSKPASQRNREAINQFNLIKNILASMTLPSAFLLLTEDGSLVVGTLKDEGMEEPISSYHFKHGGSGLSNIQMIGIKEVSQTAFNHPGTDFLNGILQTAEAFKEMTFPPEAIRTTPIAVFRHIPIIPIMVE